MVPERSLVDSISNADVLLSTNTQEGGALIITAHRIGGKTSYNVWERRPGGTPQRITMEERRKGRPKLENFRGMLTRVYVSRPEYQEVEELIEEVSKKAK